MSNSPTPTNARFIPYGRQWIDEDDIAAVTEVLRSDWLTTGPMVERFEKAVADAVGARHAVAMSSGTAALHACMHALHIGPGDEVIVPPMTFAATANCVVYQGGTPVFADVVEDTLLLDPHAVEAKITPRTRAIIAVDYAGQPCDYAALQALAKDRGLALVADACHSLGAEWQDQAVGTLADLTVFSFHPVKHITTAEGGMVTTNNPESAQRLRTFRNHGITTDHRQREQMGSWFYEMVDLGYNYRLSDLNCALGLSQLRKLPGWIQRRREIASLYDDALRHLPGIRPLTVNPGVKHAYHLYVVRVDENVTGISRAEMFSGLRNNGVGVNVHYVPVHLHPYYRTRFETKQGMYPVAEKAYQRILSLPMFPRMSDADVERVLQVITQLVSQGASSRACVGAGAKHAA